MAIHIAPSTNTIGAEVTGIDLSKPISGEDAEVLRNAWMCHLVLVFRDHDHVSAQQHLTATYVFGEPDIDEGVRQFCHPDHPEILVLSNEMKGDKPSGTRDVGWQWHMDFGTTTRPPAGAILHAHAVPEAGGDTMFANMYRAYETLSPRLQSILEQLEGVHDDGNALYHAHRDPNQGGQLNQKEAQVQVRLPIRHPMVRVHPVTKRKTLMHNPGYIRHFHGMTREESAPLLGFLAQHATQPEFTYRHRWRVGDMLIWDNRCTLHKVVADHHHDAAPGSVGRLRKLHRTTLRGEPSGAPVEI